MPSPAFIRGALFLKVFSYIALVYATIAWGSTFILVKNAAAETGPLTLVAYRFGIAGALMFIFLLLRKESPFLHLRFGVNLGILLALLYITQTVGLTYTTATNSGFITGLFVAFLPLFIFLIEKKRPIFRDLLVVTLSLVGLWFLTGGIRGGNYGDLLTVFAAAAYAAYIPLADLYLKNGANPLALIAQSFLTTSILSFFGAIVLGESFLYGNRSAWSAVLFLALVPSLSAYLAQFFAQRYILPLAVGAIFLLEPVFATVFSVFWGGETLHAAQLLGGLIILAAMATSLDWKKTALGSPV